MKNMDSYWLEPVEQEADATPDLGFYLAGGAEQVTDLEAQNCPGCGEPLHLLAVYRRSPYILLDRFEAIVLMICPVCAEESDGSEGSNGITPKLVEQELAGKLITGMSRHLSEPVYFSATDTGEPRNPVEFKDWKKDKVRGKLGGLQISIQGGVEDESCKLCEAPYIFLASLDECWARMFLNFGGGMGYLFVCSRECSPESAFFYWDC